ncbi:MAG: DUF3999 family protein, partial [Planctomycetota bacterium]|nr:DUF3999 family protein [Planctomycetota bacterium]
MNAVVRTCTAVVLSVWAWTAAPAPARAQEPAWGQWRCVADVQRPASPEAGLVELPLPARVFALARTDLGDLRLADPAGRAVPYVLRVDEGAPARPESYQPARMYNPVFLPGKTSSVCVDFGNRRPRTRVDVDTPGTNFRRRVSIEAGPDGENWQVLQSGWLFRIGDGGQSYDKSRVELPDNDFRYLRVTVFNAPDDPGQLTISQVLGWWEKATPPQKVDVPVAAVKATEDAKARTTEIALDMAHENLPIYELTIGFKEANYLRRVEVLGRNRLTRTIEEPVEDDQQLAQFGGRERQAGGARR